MKRTIAAGMLVLFFAAGGYAAAKKIVDLSHERAGSQPARFLAVVGDWSIASDGGANVVQLDGGQRIKGQPSAGLAG